MSLRGVPRVARGLVDRPRLTAALEADSALIVLRAPMGYGKTVAMAQWAQGTGRTGVWLRIPEGVSEPSGLVARIAEALADHSLLPDDSPLADAPAALQYRSRADAWELLGRGLRQRDAQLTIALDECDALPDDVLEGLVRLIQDVPALSVRATVRRFSPLAEPALRLLLDAEVLDADELAFTHSEAVAVIGDARAAREAVAAGGAAVLLRAVALGVRGTGSDPARAVQDVIRSLLRVRGVGWDGPFADFVERAAIADTVDAGFAAELTGAEDAETLLARAEHDGLGWWTAPPRGPAPAQFVFSPFVRAAAEEALRARLPAPQFRAVVLRVADWERRNGRPFPALRRAVECEHWPLVNDVIREHWYDLLPSGAAVQALFRRVSPATLRSWPLIAMLLAIIANARGDQRLRALEYFALATHGSRRQREGASPADRILLRTIEAAAHRVTGRPERGVEPAREAYRTLRETSPDERDRLGRNEPVVWLHLGLCFFYADDSETALDCLRRGVAVSAARRSSTEVTGLALIAGIQAASGDVVDARRVAAQSIALPWPDGWLDGYPGSFYQLARTFFALEAGDPDEAQAVLGILDRHRATIEHWPLLTHVDAVIRLWRRRPEEALLLLDAVEEQQAARHATAALTRARLRHTRAMAELARGDAPAAERALAKEPDGPRVAVSRARIALAEGGVDRAARLLHAHSADAVSSRQRAEHLALRAAAAALLDPGDPRLPGLLAQLAALLADRELLLPLVFVPTAGLDALAAVSTDPGLLGRLERARAVGMIGPVSQRPRLTPRETVVARELARCESVAQLAQTLVVSPNTVKSQLSSLYRKLGVRTREDALRALMALGLTGPEAPPDR